MTTRQPRLARAILVLALVASSGIALIGGLGVALLVNGVVATGHAGWTVDVPLAGRSLRLSVPGLIRLATAPGIAHLLDGRRFSTSAGTIGLHRDGDALRLRCAPCRLQHAQLASVPLRLDRLELTLARRGAALHGELTATHRLPDATAIVRLRLQGQLAADQLRIEWELPPTELATAVRLFASIAPEAGSARIEGQLRAQGTLSLPARRGTAAFDLQGLEVGGLGTEALQFGWFAHDCAPPGAARRIVTGDGEARWVPLERIGPTLIAAVIAAEDQRFHRHAGFDDAAVAALLADVDAAGLPRGASTLTQQLARTLFTGAERSFARKLREWLVAVEMERTLGKERILELYLNTVDWGPGICGARAAARTYFRKRPDQLTPLEAAWLAGILRAPHAAHHTQFVGARPDSARALWVLRQMRGLPKPERDRWAGRPLQLAAPPGRLPPPGSTQSHLPVAAR
jgi:hypothetical protein